MSTVVYQETANKFTSTDQKIADSQILTVKYSPSDKPQSNGDFIGQFALALGDPKDPKLYTWCPAHGGWNPVSLNLGEVTNIATKDKANDFTEYKQSIKGSQIASVKQGTKDPDHTMITGDGQLYINTANEKVWICSGGAWLEITGDDTTGVAKLASANDFTEVNQTIVGHPIVSMSTGAVAPPVPNTRDGQIYIQLSETTGSTPRMYMAINHSQPALPQWEEITYTLPSTVAKTSEKNNFQPTEQKIAGKQILSFVDGGDQDPGQSKLPADYDGQFYVAVKTNPQGVKDAALWIAHGNQWLPALTVPEVDTSNFAKIGPSDSNNFQNIYQTLGAAGQNRRVMTCRVKIGGHAPNADASWEAYVNGEETLYVNGDEISLWKAMWERDILNPPSHSYWRQIWPSIDTKNVAFLNAENIFKNRQFMDGPHGKKNFTVASRGAETPYNLITPYNIGDLYIQDISIDGRTGIKLWVATDNGQPQGWKTVYDSLFEEDRSAKLDLMDKGITDNAEAIAHNDKDIADLLIKFDGHQKDIEDINKELDAVDVRFDADVRSLGHIGGAISVKHGELVFVDRTPYFALQRGHDDWARVLTSYNLSGKTFDALSEEHDTLSTTVDTHSESINGHDTRISAAHTHAQDAHDAIGDHDTRITALEESPEYVLPDTVVQTDKNNVLTGRLTLENQAMVIKDPNWPRFELWMGAQHEGTRVRYSTIELNSGQIKIQGKNSSHQVEKSITIPSVGNHLKSANLISDQCTKFTDLEAFKVSSTEDLLDHETRIATLEAVEPTPTYDDTEVRGLIDGLDTRITAVEEAGTGVTDGLTAQDLADTPHVIKGSKVAEGYLEFLEGGTYPADTIKDYSQFFVKSGAATYIRLPPISNSPDIDISYPLGKVISFERTGNGQTVLSITDTGGAKIYDINGDEVSLKEIFKNTRVKLVTTVIDGVNAYKVISEESTELEKLVESQKTLIDELTSSMATLTDKVSELETRLNNLQIWKLDWSATDE